MLLLAYYLFIILFYIYFDLIPFLFIPGIRDKIRKIQTSKLSISVSKHLIKVLD